MDSQMIVLSTWQLWLIIPIIVIAICDGILKLIAMWKAACNREVAWFVLLAVFNTMCVLPLIYILMKRKKPAA